MVASTAAKQGPRTGNRNDHKGLDSLDIHNSILDEIPVLVHGIDNQIPRNLNRHVTGKTARKVAQRNPEKRNLGRKNRPYTQTHTHTHEISCLLKHHKLKRTRVLVKSKTQNSMYQVTFTSARFT